MKMLFEENREIASLAKEIADLTHNNYHNESVISLAKYLKLTKFVKILTNVENIHGLMGNLDMSLYAFRSKIHQNVFDYAEQNLSVNNYKKLMNSF
jgi:hypothetical protein